MGLNLLRRENGQSMVELAIIFPMVALLILGVADLGRGVSSYIVLTNGAREGARWLSTRPTDYAGARQQALDELARANITANDVNISTQSGVSGTIAAVTIDYQFPLLSGLLGTASITIQANVSMPVL